MKKFYVLVSFILSLFLISYVFPLPPTEPAPEKKELPVEFQEIKVDELDYLKLQKDNLEQRFRAHQLQIKVLTYEIEEMKKQYDELQKKIWNLEKKRKNAEKKNPKAP